MDLPTTLREVCKVFNLCSISLQDSASVSTSMVFDTVSNSLQSLVRLLWHFCREEVDSVRFLSLCLLLSLRTWSITSSNWRPQAVLGPRKSANRHPRLCRARTRDPEAAGSSLRAMSSLWSHTATHRVLAWWCQTLTSVTPDLSSGRA